MKTTTLSKEQEMFIASIGHDLRSPLNCIMGATDVLLSMTEDTDQIILMEMQKRSAETMLTYIENLMTYIKFNRGQFVLEKTEFNFKAMLNSISDIFRLQAKSKGLNLDINYDDRIPLTVVGDRIKLSQIISNLVGNAIKFTEEGCVNVDVSISKETKKKLFFVIKVSDSGRGIPVDKIDSIFDAFKQVNHNDEKQGFGLGLHTTRVLLKKMKGDVEVSSELGKGTVFKLSLPLEKVGHVEVSSDAANLLIVNEKIDKKLLKEPLKILYIDNTVSNHLLLKAFLKDKPILVDSATSMKQGIEYYKNSSYDIVLVDHFLGDESRVDIACKLRKVQEEKDYTYTPIVSLTANTFKEDIDNMLKSGFDNFLIKPSKKREVINTIYKTIQYFRKKNDEARS